MSAAFGFSAAYFAFLGYQSFRYVAPASCIFMALAAAQCHARLSFNFKIYEKIFLLLCIWFMWASQHYQHDAYAVLKSLKIDRPKVLLLDFDLGVGQPIIRDIGGTLVNPGLHPWITVGALAFLEDPATAEERLQIARWIEWERNLTAREVEKNPPDIVLVGNSSYPNLWIWANMNVSLANTLKRYKQIASTEYVYILIKKTPEELAEQALRPPLID